MLRLVESEVIVQHCLFSITGCFGLRSAEVFGAKLAEEPRDGNTECGASFGVD